jgi:hypothetical protein
MQKSMWMRRRWLLSARLSKLFLLPRLRSLSRLRLLLRMAPVQKSGLARLWDKGWTVEAADLVRVVRG